MLRHLSALWRNIFKRRHLDQELDEELQSYVELVAAEKQSRGMPAGQAYREARREFESVARVKEEVRDVRAGAAMDTLVQDFRYAFRILAGNISFSAIVIVTLALGIGANLQFSL